MRSVISTQRYVECLAYTFDRKTDMEIFLISVYVALIWDVVQKLPLWKMVFLLRQLHFLHRQPTTVQLLRE